MSLTNQQKHTLEALQQLLKASQDVIAAFNSDKGCLTCKNYLFPHCQLIGMTPPAHVIKDGCNAYEIDPTSPPF